MAKKIALVTGGSRGLGKDMALCLAKKGIDVILTYHTKKEEAEKTAAEIERMGQKAAVLQLNVEEVKSLDGFITQVMNIMVDSFDRVFVYEGSELENLKISSFEDTHGIRQEIMNKAKRVKAECPLTAKGEKREIICLIKLLPGARYQNMVDILDDMKILEVKTYALQEPLNEEIAAIAQKTKLLLAKR